MKDSLSSQPSSLQSAMDTQLVEINPPLPCQTPACGAFASVALAERDPHMYGAWRLLPLCLACVRALQAASQ